MVPEPSVQVAPPFSEGSEEGYSGPGAEPQPDVLRSDDATQRLPRPSEVSAANASQEGMPTWFARAMRSSSQMFAATNSETSKPTSHGSDDQDLPSRSRERLLQAITRANNGRATRYENRRAADIIACRSLDGVAAAVIVLNVVSIGISADLYPESPFWIFVDAGFALFFLVEILHRLHQLKCAKLFFGHDARRNMFEATMVFLAMLEIIAASTTSGVAKTAESAGMLAMLRVLRLARIARIARLARLQVFGDLIMMINGALGGVRTLLWSIFLIAIPLFVLALIMRESLGPETENFANLPTAFFTVFRCIVAGECTDQDGKPIFSLVSSRHGWIYGIIYCIAVLFMTFGLFNVIVAIYVENTLAAAKYNDATQKRQRLMDQQMFTEKAIELVEFIWRTGADNPGVELSPSDFEEASMMEITPLFFEELRSYKEFQDILRGLDIADEDQLDLFDTLDVDGGGTIDVDELVRGIAKLRGDARRSDIIGVSLMMRSMQLGLSELGEAMGLVQAALTNITDMAALNVQQSEKSHVGARWTGLRRRKSIIAIPSKSTADYDDWEPPVSKFHSDGTENAEEEVVQVVASEAPDKLRLG